MATDPNTLEINIQVNDNGAVRKIDAVTAAVNDLSTAVGGSNLGNLKDLADGLRSLSQSASALSKISQPFAGITQSIGSLQTALKSFRIKDVSANISGMKAALDGSADAFKPINRVANSLKKMNDLSKMPDFRKNLQEKLRLFHAAFTTLHVYLIRHAGGKILLVFLTFFRESLTFFSRRFRASPEQTPSSG